MTFGRRIKEHWKKIRHAITTPLIAYSGIAFLWILLFTCRFRVKGLTTFIDTAKKHPTILMLWHNRLLISPYILSKFTKKFIFTAFISNSRDGDLIATVTKCYKRGRTIRVPHQARHHALREVVRYLQQNDEIIVITPDGPRGPRYQIKPGIVFAAREASASVIPFSWSSTKYWELNTWDRMRIPKPFSTITVVFGDPVNFSKESSLEMSEEILVLQKVLETIESSK